MTLWSGSISKLNTEFDYARASEVNAAKKSQTYRDIM